MDVGRTENRDTIQEMYDQAEALQRAQLRLVEAVLAWVESCDRPESDNSSNE